jgi:hypothetical protein
MPRRPTAERVGLSYVYVVKTARGKNESFIDVACRTCAVERAMRLSELLEKAHHGTYTGLCPSCARKK